MSDAPVFICENRECDVAQKKVCVEGLELTKCPHFGKPPTEDPADAEVEITGEPLPLGKKLSLAEASDLLGEGPSRLVAMIGPSEAGKTSLIASLFDLFQMGSVADVDFAGSRTLFEFEETCHDARAASRGLPHKSRTPRGEVQFYHLDIALPEDGAHLALALADRGGEEYQDAMDEISKVDEFAEIARADTICVLVDGARLLNNGERHNLKFEINQIFAALREGGSLLRKPQLALILTKLDVVRGAENETRAVSDLQELKETITQDHGDQFSAVASFHIAASPTEHTVPRGTGIPELLSFWLTTRETPSVMPATAPKSERMFGRFGVTDKERAN